MHLSLCNNTPVNLCEVHPQGFAKIVRGCAADLANLTFSIPVFAWLHTHQYTIFDRKAPNFANWVLFTMICSNTPNLCNCGSLVSDENPPIAIPNFVKKHPKRQVHIRIPCQCETPCIHCIWQLTYFSNACFSFIPQCIVEHCYYSCLWLIPMSTKRHDTLVSSENIV